MSTRSGGPQIGRSHAKVGWGRHHLPLVLAAWAGAALVIWHLALVLTGGLPLIGLGYTVRALVQLDPIDGLPSLYRPISGLLAVLVAVVLLAGVIVGWVWLRCRWDRQRSGIGLAGKRQPAGRPARFGPASGVPAQASTPRRGWLG